MNAADAALDAQEHRRGLLSALAAYSFWGIAPIYFVWVSFAGPVEVLAHRVASSLVLLLGLLAVTRQWREVARLSGRQWLGLTLSASLISVNWLVFVWAVFNERMLETSLGYYINPLMTVLLGVFVLGERPRRLQWVALGIAVVAMASEVLRVGTLPWTSLCLAATFALYGLVRRQIGVGSILGLSVETGLLLPLALVYLIWLTLSGQGSIAEGDGVAVAKLMLGGLVTIIPLLLFAAAALRVNFTLLGFVQYLAPSLTFLLAIFVYAEPLAAGRLQTFGLIWLAIALFSAEGVWHARKTKRG